MIEWSPPKVFNWEPDGESGGLPKFILKYGDYVATVNHGYDNNGWAYRVNGSGKLDHPTALHAMVAAEEHLVRNLQNRISNANVMVTMIKELGVKDEN